MPCESSIAFFSAVKPITPNEIAEKKTEQIPDGVIDAFNELIAQNYRNGSSTVKQKDAVSRIKAKLNLEKDNDIYSNNWLDVEPIYRAAGWKVKYDKPAYCESYDAYFVFSR